MKEYKTRKVFSALPEEVFDALTKPFAIELWTGCSAKFELRKGAEFEMWDGDICGEVVDFEVNKSLSEEWYFGDQEERSIAAFKFFPKGKEKTTVYLEHTNIPDDAYDDIVDGWENTFFASLQHFLEDEE